MARQTRGFASTGQQRALLAVCAAVFMLLAAPRARIGPAGIPVYLFDVLGVLAFALAYTLPYPTGAFIRRAKNLFAAFMVLILISQINCAVLLTSTTNAAYMAARYVSSGMLAVAFYKLAARRESFDLLIKTIIAGSCFSAAFSILSSLPFTRSLIEPLLRADFLNPAAKFVRLDSQYAMRGNTLIGTSTITAGFLASMWPIVACMPLIAAGPSSVWNRFRGAMAALVAFGALATYSRGGLVALGAACAVLLVKGSVKTRRASTALIVAVCAVAYMAPKDSDALMIDRYDKRFGAMIDGVRAGGQFESSNEAGRFQSYIYPFLWVLDHPEAAIMGYGNDAGKRTKFNRGTVPWYDSHALVPRTMYQFGAVAAVILVWLLTSTVTGLGRQRAGDSEASTQASASIYAMFAAASIWFLVGHAAISTTRGFTLTMIMIALALAVRTHLRPDSAILGLGVRAKGG